MPEVPLPVAPAVVHDAPVNSRHNIASVAAEADLGRLDAGVCADRHDGQLRGGACSRRSRLASDAGRLR